MEFINELVEKEFEESNIVRPIRKFEPIRVKANVWLSIQASYGHFCRPRVTMTDLGMYTHWEIALFNENDTGFLRVKDVFPEFLSLAEIELYYDGGPYSCVPTDLVEELFMHWYMPF